MTVEKLEVELTPLQQAEVEVKRETNAKAVRLLKDKLKEKQRAELVLSNIDREIDDLVEQIEQGDV